MFASATLICTIFGSQSDVFFFKSVNLRRGQIDHVIGDVLVHLRLGRGHRLQNVAEFET